MSSIDGGVKYKGMSLEGEYYWRWLGDYTGSNTGGIPDITDTGYQMQASAMVVPRRSCRPYIGGSQIFGDYGNPSEVRVGANWYFSEERGLRLNSEFINVHHSPGRLHGLSDAGRRERAGLSHQRRDEFLITD